MVLRFYLKGIPCDLSCPGVGTSVVSCEMTREVVLGLSV